MTWLVVGLGGFVGAVARHGIMTLLQVRLGGASPLGTLCVNVLGCGAIGLLWVLVEERRLVSTDLQMFLGAGVLGGLTTFSTFGHESMALLRAGEVRLSLLSVAANLVLGFGAVALGRALGRLVA